MPWPGCWTSSAQQSLEAGQSSRAPETPGTRLGHTWWQWRSHDVLGATDPSGWILREGESLACLRTQRLPLSAMPLVSHGGLGGSLADKLSLPFGSEIRSELLQCHFLTKSSLTWSGPAESLRSGRLQEAAEHGQKDQGFGPPRACVGPAQPCAGCFTYSSNLSSAPQGSPL